MSVLEWFCDVDDFMLIFAPQWKASELAAGKQRQRSGQMWPSEFMTILIHFHQSHYRTFKAYYTEHVQVHLSSEFPHLVSYARFVALIPTMMIPMWRTCKAAMGPAPASVSLTRPPWKSATTPNASLSIGSLR